MNLAVVRTGWAAAVRRAARRWSSSASVAGGQAELVSTSVDTATGVATLQLHAGPANVLGFDLCEQAADCLAHLEADPAVHTCVFTAAKTGIFSAGLDLKEFHRPDAARVRDYWWRVQTMYHKLYTTRLLTVARMNGHSPAGGCMIGLACDARYMLARPPAAPEKGEFKIGLNEAQLGLPVPWWVQQLMLDTVGRRHGERALCLGVLYGASDALSIGLVDALANTEDQLDGLVAAEVQAASLVPHETRHIAKLRVRHALAEGMAARLDEDCVQFAEVILSPGMQAGLEKYMQAMEKRKAK